MSGPWTVLAERGTAARLHSELPPATARLVRVAQVDGGALVIGSAQPAASLVPAPTVPVVRRRTGGGAVWVEPGDPVWIDIAVPADDALWDGDVGRSFQWVGRAWAEALSAIGLPDLSVHEGAMAGGPLSRMVCFAGVGPGEVLSAGRKVVGLAQRRTRAGAVFQCACPRSFDPMAVLRHLALPPSERAEAAGRLATTVTGVGAVTAGEVVEALVQALPRG